MINSTCTATFALDKRVHMMTVASAFIMGRNGPNNEFLWTGYDGMSHDNLHDIVYFFEDTDCVDGSGFYNITMDSDSGFIPTINCQDNGGPIAGLKLQNFVYDISRSVQDWLNAHGYDQPKSKAIKTHSNDF